MTDCVFCRIIAGELPAYKVYENDQVLAFLDITPINPGHILIAPKEHYQNLLDLPLEIAGQMLAVIKKIAPAVLKGTGAIAFNLGLNNGRGAGQAVDHVHWHLMPRFAGDGHELWQGKEYQDGQAKEVVEKIRENL